MADGDRTELAGVAIVNGDQIRAEIVSGPGSGQRWTIRDGDIDLSERLGEAKYLGQGDLLRLRAWIDAAPGPLAVEQYGVDQWGRLVGSIEYQDESSDWSVVCRDEGRGTYEQHGPSPVPATIDWTPRRAGAGIADPLTLDRTRP